MILQAVCRNQALEKAAIVFAYWLLHGNFDLTMGILKLVNAEAMPTYVLRSYVIQYLPDIFQMIG